MKMPDNVCQKLQFSSSSQLSPGVLREAYCVLTVSSAVKKWGQAGPNIPTSFLKKTLLWKVILSFKKMESSQDAMTNISTLDVLSMFQSYT